VEFYHAEATPLTQELGNFYPCPVKVNFGEELGVKTFQNTEAAYHALKLFYCFADKQSFPDDLKDLQNADAEEAFRISRKYTTTDETPMSNGKTWGEGRQSVMYGVLLAKFSQPYFSKILKSTQDKPLIENTGEREQQRAWGVNSSGPNAGDRQNDLGRLLQIVRDNLPS
jgi:predicted NAD-dependent protein-ADP-ribosyltransferase YbiA (DUF1768 family)